MSENGFLLNNELIFSADLYIAAMGRSGSTSLANMLTTPPKRWVLVEPWFVHGAVSRSVKDRWAEFGWEVRDKDWWFSTSNRNHDAFVHRYREFLAPHLAMLQRWGVKEVRGDFHIATIATINPKRTIILVRNIRDVIRSLLEKQIRQQTEQTHGLPWIEKYLSEAAESLIKLSRSSSANCRIVRFEELMHDKSAQNKLSDWLDWPLDGDPNAGLSALGRGYEVKRRTMGEQRLLPPNAELVIAELAEKMTDYQAAFGYH